MKKVTNHKTMKRASALLLVFFLLLGILISTPPVSNTAQAEVKPLDGSWEPLQDPEPATEDALSYTKLCGISEIVRHNVVQDDHEFTETEKLFKWYNPGMDRCVIASGMALITPVRDPEQEKNGYFSFVADFNKLGITNSEKYTSNPVFSVLWGNSWDLASMTVEPYSGFVGWGPASQPIKNISVQVNPSSCNVTYYGTCPPSTIDIGPWTDPTSNDNSSGEYWNKLILHTRNNTSNWQSFLMENDDTSSDLVQWFKPELHQAYHLNRVDYPGLEGPQKIADKTGGTFSIRYVTKQQLRNKVTRFKFTIKRKNDPGIDPNERPFVGAVYKSYDKSEHWVASQFIVADNPTKEYYDLLRVNESLQQNDYSTNKSIPAHELGFQYNRGDSNTYWKEIKPSAPAGTCLATSLTKQYRYKTFDTPDRLNAFSIPSIRDPKTGEVINLEPHYNKYNNDNWWEGTYRGFKVQLWPTKIKDTDGVSNWRAIWIPDVNTPKAEKIKINITLNLKERGVKPQVLKLDATPGGNEAAPVITLTQDGNPVEKDYPVIVEVTKPDGTKLEYETKTDNKGKLVNLDGTELKTDTSMSGNEKDSNLPGYGYGQYTVNVTKLGPEKTAVDTNCYEHDNSKGYYRVFSAAADYIEVQKVNASNVNLMGAEFKVYPDKDGKPDFTAQAIEFVAPDGTTSESNDKPVKGSWISTSSLSMEKQYWLVETKAPLAHQLALPVAFKLTDSGITLISPGNDQTTVITTGNTATQIQDTALKTKVGGEKVKDKYVFKFKDVEIGQLPAAGSTGWLTATILGIVLMSIAFSIAMPRRRTSSIEFRNGKK